MATLLISILAIDFHPTQTTVLPPACLQSGAARLVLDDNDLSAPWPSNTDWFRTGLGKLLASSAPSP